MNRLPSPAYCELIADSLHRDGWSWGFHTIATIDGRTLYHVDAHKNGIKIVAETEDLTTSFLEVERDAPRTAAQHSPHEPQ